MSPKPQSAPRMLSLDGLRGAAAMAVVLSHYTSLSIWWPIVEAHGVRPPLRLNLGEFGVELFFMISGFVIPLSMTGKTPGQFFRSRFIRLYPTFWICLLFSTVIHAIFLRDVTVGKFLANLTMIPRQFLGPSACIEGSYWTLECELFFYLACAAAVFLFRTSLVAVLSVLAAIYFLSLSSNFSALVEQAPRLLQVLYYRPYGWLFIPYAHLFLIGAASSQRAHLGNRLYWTIIGCCLALCLYEDAINPTEDEAGWQAVVSNVLTLVAFLAALPAGRSSEPSSASRAGPSAGIAAYQRFLTSPFLIFLGRISYPLYLVHFGIGMVILPRLAQTNALVYPSFFLAIVCAIAVATFIADFLDNPLRNRLQKVL